MSTVEKMTVEYVCGVHVHVTQSRSKRLLSYLTGCGGLWCGVRDSTTHPLKLTR